MGQNPSLYFELEDQILLCKRRLNLENARDVESRYSLSEPLWDSHGEMEVWESSAELSRHTETGKYFRNSINLDLPSTVCKPQIGTIYPHLNGRTRSEASLLQEEKAVASRRVAEPGTWAKLGSS